MIDNQSCFYIIVSVNEIVAMDVLVNFDVSFYCFDVGAARADSRTPHTLQREGLAMPAALPPPSRAAFARNPTLSKDR